MSRIVKPYPITAPRNDKERLDLVKRTAAQLGEHFDSVVVICTKAVDGGTSRFDWGSGNTYAIQASVAEVAQAWGAPTRVDPSDEDDDD